MLLRHGGNHYWQKNHAIDSKCVFKWSSLSTSLSIGTSVEIFLYLAVCRRLDDLDRIMGLAYWALQYTQPICALAVMSLWVVTIHATQHLLFSHGDLYSRLL